MSETLGSMINSYLNNYSKSTPNFQVIDKRLSDETIQLRGSDIRLGFSSFQNSDLTNMKFIDISFTNACFDNCVFKNCRFKNMSFVKAMFANCVFKNCQFIDCNLVEADAIETIFNECMFLKNMLNMNFFELCHFIEPVFKDISLGSSALVDSKFSNSKKSIEFEGEVFFIDVFDQIEKFFID